MTLRKFVTYLNYIACVVAGMGIVGSFAVKHIDAFALVHSHIMSYLILVGALMMVPLWLYKDFHHKEFKKENKDRWIHTAVIIATCVLFLIIKEYVL